MHHRHTIAPLALIVAMAVGACEREPTVSDPAGGEPADAPADIQTPAPETTAAPRLRAGLWSVSTTTDGVGQVTRMCIDDAVQSRMSVIGGQMAGGACQTSEMTPRAGGGWSMRSVCDMGPGGRMVSQGVVTGDFRNTYRNETTVTTSGASVAHMNRTVTQVSEGRHEGACPEGMNPGDIEMPGGMRLNMLEMAEMAARMGAP